MTGQPVTSPPMAKRPEGGLTVVVVAADLRARVEAGQALAARGLHALRSSVSVRAALHDAASLPRPCTLLLLLPLAGADLGGVGGLGGVQGVCALASGLGLRVLVVDPLAQPGALTLTGKTPVGETLPDLVSAAARLAQLSARAAGRSAEGSPGTVGVEGTETPRPRAALREARARGLPPGPSSLASPQAAPERSGGPVPLVLVGASTGGPRVVAELLGGLPADFGGAVLLAQHLLDGFGAAMVGWLDSLTPLSVELARHGEPVRRGRVYLAPDGSHLALRGHVLQVLNTPPEGGYRPNIDVLFRSAAPGINPALLTGVLLTGMGQDGAEGLALLHRLGATTIVQDPATAVVASMPQQALSRFQPSFVAAPERMPSLLLWRANAEPSSVERPEAGRTEAGRTDTERTDTERARPGRAGPHEPDTGRQP